MSRGKVWLVGAGPGDVGLFTIKGRQVLEQAEVVVYDRLVGQGILAMVPETATCIDVGKRAGHHTMPQEEINQVLLREAGAGKKVVRLKGGDPFLFGRGGEELELLAEHGIPYEIVPGITSPIAVPAYNGIPVTHRDYCSSLHIITGHKRQDKKEEKESYTGDSPDAGPKVHDSQDIRMGINFRALVETKGTLVFLMGVTALSDICGNLIEAGMEPDMPAAILQKGTTAGQKRIVSTVSELPREAERQGIKTPAIIVVGRVCSLADTFAWYEQLPLAGKKIVVTRPRELVSAMAEKLRRLGAEVLELPSIRTAAIEKNPELSQCLEQIHVYEWIGFTSQVGVRIFFDKMMEAGKDIRSLAGIKFAVIGAGTAQELSGRGIVADVMPDVYDGASMARAMAADGAMQGKKVLLPRAKAGSPEVVQILEEAGAVVEDVAIYDTMYEHLELIDEKAEFESGNIDYAVFTSASTVRGFAKSTEGLDYARVHAVCIGRQTAAEAANYGMRCYVAEKATMDSVADKVCELCKGVDGHGHD